MDNEATVLPMFLEDSTLSLYLELTDTVKADAASLRNATLSTHHQPNMSPGCYQLLRTGKDLHWMLLTSAGSSISQLQTVGPVDLLYGGR